MHTSNIAQSAHRLRLALWLASSAALASACGDDGAPDHDVDAPESGIDDVDGDGLPDAQDTQVDTDVSPWPTGEVSCAGVFRLDPLRASGVYLIDPDAEGAQAPIEVECLMGVANDGWTRLTPAWHAWLLRTPTPAVAREYLYRGVDGAWYRTAATTRAWSWQDATAVSGVWFSEHSDGHRDTFDCGPDDVSGVGFGCASPNGPWLTGDGASPATGAARLCLGDDCGALVAIYVRDVPCPGAVDNLLDDGALSSFAAGAASCWRVPLADLPGRPGAGVTADDDGAREGHAPALRADEVSGAWLTTLLYDSVDLSGSHAYRLSFWARAAAPRPLAVGLVDRAAAGTRLALTREWRRYELAQAPTRTELGANLEVLFGDDASSASVWVDDFALEDLGPFECIAGDGELLADGGFRAGTACWSSVQSSATSAGRVIADSDAPAPTSAPSLRVDHDLTAIGSGPVLTQRTAPLMGGHGYELRLAARGAGESLRVDLATTRTNGWPTGGDFDLDAGWSTIVARWDTPADFVDLAGALLRLESSGPGPGTLWLDDVRLVDLGADPCAPSIWTERGVVPDGDLDFGLRCWTVDAPPESSITAVVNDASLRPSAPSLRISSRSPGGVIDIASSSFELAAGRWVLTLQSRAEGFRSLMIELRDDRGGLIAARSVDVVQRWQVWTEVFDLQDTVTVRLHLVTSASEMGALWIDELTMR